MDKTVQLVVRVGMERRRLRLGLERPRGRVGIEDVARGRDEQLQARLAALACSLCRPILRIRINC